MPTRLAQFPPDGWQVVRREDGHWLQQRQADGSWIDVRGPFKQRGAANDYYRRLDGRYIRQLRKADPHNPELPENQ